LAEGAGQKKSELLSRRLFTIPLGFAHRASAAHHSSMFQVLRDYADTFRSLDGHADKGLLRIVASLDELENTLSDIALVLRKVQEASEEGSDAGSRLAELERSRELWEANAEAHMLKGDALFKNARNAEERVRVAMRKDAEADNGSPALPPESTEEMIAAYRQLGVSVGADADAEEHPSLLPYNREVQPRQKARALKAKFR